MWVAVAIGSLCAALGLRLYLVFSIMKIDRRRWVRLAASLVIISTTMVLIFWLDGLARSGLVDRFVDPRNRMAWNIISSVMALDLVGSVYLVATSSKGWWLAKTLLIAAAFLIMPWTVLLITMSQL